MSLRFLTAGESHGPLLTAILDGMPAGLPLSPADIAPDLARRQTGYGAGPRMRIERDQAQITGGVMAGQTTGAPIALQIINRDHSKWSGKAIPAYTTPRPGHADLAGLVKFGHNDIRPVLERASARETAARVAVGAICRTFLAQFGVRVEAWVRSIADIQADLEGIPLEERFHLSRESEVACPDAKASQKMAEKIRKTMQDKQTLGGVIELAAFGVPAGLGSCVQWDQRLEARLAAAILSVQAFKGIEIGDAFENTCLPGTQAQDAILLEGVNLHRRSNRAGGIEGGMSNGQPILLRAAMKPIATTLTPQASVDLAAGTPQATTYERSDFCPVPRAPVIVEAMTAFILADALISKLGGDSLSEMLPRFSSLRQLNTDHLRLSDAEKTFWMGTE